MVVIQVVNVRWFNATAWYGLYLARLLQEAGHQVAVITLAGTETHRKALEWGLDARPMDLNTSNPLRLAVTLVRLVRLLRELGPQVVNCHRGEGFFLWGLLKALGFGFRLARTRGDQRPPRADALNRLLHAKVADAVVVTNSRMARHFLSAMRTPEHKVWLIHGGVDRERFRFDPEGRERVRAEFGYGPKETVFALVGRFDKVKGQRETLEALAGLVKQGYRRARLLLVGFGSATGEDEVRGWIRELGLERFVRITGKREDIAACLSAADAGVVASLWSETIARAALELMAAGRPLISTDVGVMPDLLPPQALFPPGDVDALRKAMTRIMEEPSYRQELVREGDLTLSQLSGRDFLQRTLTLYEGFLDER